MEVALELFAEKGYHAASIKDIIQKADIAKGTFYLHFEGKFDLLERIVLSRIDILNEHVKVLDISRPGPISEIRDIYKNFVNALAGIKKFKQFVRIVLSENIDTDTSLTEQVNAFFDSTIDMTAKYIKTAQDMGRVFPHLDNEISAKCIVGSVRELLYRWAVREEKIDFQKALPGMLDLYLNGLLVERQQD